MELTLEEMVWDDMIKLGYDPNDYDSISLYWEHYFEVMNPTIQ